MDSDKMNEEFSIELIDTGHKYSISNMGRVINIINGNFVQVSKSKGTFNAYDLEYKKPPKQINASRLVAKIFCDNPGNKKFVLHLNGDKYDRRSINLRWVDANQIKDFYNNARIDTFRDD